MAFKKFMAHLKFDQNLIEDLMITFESISIRYSLFVKFEEIWTEKIKMQDRFPLSKDTSQQLKNMSWLIFIIAKSTHFFINSDRLIGRLLNDARNVGDLAFLLCAVLYLVVQYAPSDVICEVFESKSEFNVHRSKLFDDDSIQEGLPEHEFNDGES
jgi:hypothetical protein